MLNIFTDLCLAGNDYLTLIFILLPSQDDELQDPLSLSLNENYDQQNSSHYKPRRTPASPDYNCGTPDIQVIIKDEEEEEAWTVSDNREWRILNISIT